MNVSSKNVLGKLLTENILIIDRSMGNSSEWFYFLNKRTKFSINTLNREVNLNIQAYKQA